MCAKYYENPTMLSIVTAKNVGDVFLRHTVVWYLSDISHNVANKNFKIIRWTFAPTVVDRSFLINVRTFQINFI